MPPPVQADGVAAPPGLRTGAVVLAAAGLVWWVVGVTARADGAALLAGLGAGAAATALLLVLVARRLDGTGERELLERNRRTYTVVNVLQGAGIALVVLVCLRLGLQAWIPVGITFVFAVHLLPLGTAFRWRGWTVLAAGLALVAAAGAVLAVEGAEPALVQTVVGLAAATVLWAGVLGALVSRPRRHDARTRDVEA
jgi:hypothetical protein